MNFRLCAAAVSLLLVAGVTASAATSGSYFFRPKAGVIGPVSVEVEEPSDPVVEELTLTVTLPASVEAGDTAQGILEASGGSGSYEFSGVALPGFVQVSGDGTVTLAPGLEHVGTHSLVFRVNDGGETKEEVRSLEVWAQGQSLPLLPYEAIAEGAPVDRFMFTDGVETLASSVRMSGANATLELRYPEPVAASGAYVRVAGQNTAFAIDAWIDGEWVEMGRGSSTSARPLSFAAGEVVSDKWRLRRRSTTRYVDVMEFRPGPAPVHPLPAFSTPSGFLAARGGEAVIQTNDPASPYTNEPLKFAFAEGAVPPTGVTLSQDGVIAVAADAAISGVWHFAVEIEDGVGAKATRQFHVAAEAPAAEEIMARTFVLGDEDAIDYRFMYDGPLSLPAQQVVVTQTRPLTVDFGHPVRASSVTVPFSGPSATRLRLEYFADGEWKATGASVTTAASSSPVEFTELVASRFRVVAENVNNALVSDFRVGSGPVHDWPVFVDTAYLGTLGDEPSSKILNVAASGSYGSSGFVVEHVSGDLPDSAAIAPDGTVELPPAEEASGSVWSFALRLTDGLGFTTEKTFVIGGQSDPAEDVMAKTVTLGGQPADHRILYDGLTSENHRLDQGVSLEMDFGRAVRFDRALINLAVTRLVRFEMFAAGDWIPVHTHSAAGEQVVEFGQEYVAQRVRLVVAATIGSVNVRELRLGAGPAHSAPVIVDSGVVADLGGQEQQIALAGLVDSHYFQDAPEWTLVSGSLPGGGEIDPSGLIDLPRADDVEGAMWSFTARLTDAAGFTAEKALKVIASGKAVPASSTMATSVLRGEVPVDHRMFYDGDLVEGVTVGGSAPLTFDFGRTVLFDKVVLVSSTTNAFTLEIETPSGWVVAESVTATVTDQPISLQATYSASKIRLTRNSGAWVREFRPGAGPTHSNPVLTTPQSVVLAAQSGSQIVQAASFGTHYSSDPLEWTVVSGTLPPDAVLNANGTVDLPAADGIHGFQWRFKLRATDGVGFYSERDFTVAVPSTPASSLMPVAASVGGSPVGVDILYDGQADRTVTISNAVGLVLTFDRPVSFNKAFAHVAVGTTPVLVEAWNGSGYVPAGEFATNVSGIESTLAETWVTDRVLVKRKTSTGSQDMREFRLGAGLPHALPAYDGPAVLADLGAEPQQVEIPVRVDSPYGGEPLSFHHVGGAMPNGAELSIDGVLDLPDAETAGGTSWTFTVRVTDSYGYHTEFAVSLSASANAMHANWTMPSGAIGNIGGAKGPIDVLSLYDDNISTNVPVSSAFPLEYTYAVPVAMDSAFVSSSTGAVHVELFMDGAWQRKATLSTAGAQELDLGGTFVVEKVRLIRDTSTSATVREFRPGGGPAFSPPVLNVASVMQLGADGDAVQLTYSVDQHYRASASPAITVASGSLPPLSTIDPSGVLVIPAQDPGGWNFTLRLTDGSGFRSEKAVLAFRQGVAASSVLPQSVTEEGMTASWAVLYDGITGTDAPGLNAPVTSPLVVDFGQSVTFSSITLNHSAGTANVWAEVGGAEVLMGTMINTGAGSSLNLSHPWTAQRILIARTTGTTSVREFRVGGGVAHTPPAFADGTAMAVLGGSPITRSMAASSPTHYVSDPLAYEVAGGGLEGASIASNGLLTLPAAADASAGGGFNWAVLVRATDGVGISSEKKVYVGSPHGATEASVAIPVSSSHPNGETVLYDNDTGTQFTNITAGVILEFATPVRATSFKWRTSNTTRIFTVEAEYGGEWVEVAATATAVNAFNGMSMTFGTEVVAKRFRVKLNNSGGLNEFKLGYGGVYP